MILNVIEFDMNIADAVSQPRFHHQYMPDSIRIEKDIAQDTQSILKARGFELDIKRPMGSAQSILIENRMFSGVADPRTPDATAKGL